MGIRPASPTPTTAVTRKLQELDPKIKRDQDALKKVLAEEKKREFGETNSVLDALRRSRQSRGGTGAPLQVPSHLKDAAAGQGIVITDADLKPETE